MNDYNLLIKSLDQMKIIYTEHKTHLEEQVICIQDICCFYFDDQDFESKFLRIELIKG